MPFGNKSLEKENIGYLTAAQALADYADLIDYLQGDNIEPRYPVIAFGGMLKKYLFLMFTSAFIIFLFLLFNFNYMENEVYTQQSDVTGWIIVHILFYF